MTLTEAEIIDRARAESERRKRSRLRSFPAFGEWLPQASPAMTWDWAWQRYVQAYYDEVTAGRLRKLMIFAPPRHGKSEMGTVRYPVYRMERDPTTRVIVGAYGQTLAEKFSRKSRKLCRGRVALSKERAAVADWETTRGGGMRAVGVGGSVTGMGGDLIFIDDPVKGRKAANSEAFQNETWEWYTEDLFTRLQPGGAIILQMTRWHELDLAGRILASEDGPNWTVVKLPALAEEDDPLGRKPGEALCPEAWPVEKLHELQRVLRTAFFALFQQRPQAKDGNFFRRDWFETDERGPEPDQVASRVRWWDQAASEGEGDFTVGLRMCRTKDGRFWVEDVKRGQWAPHTRDAEIRKTAEADPPGTQQWTEQEPGSAGKTVALAFVRMLAGFPAFYETSTGSKEHRAEPYAAQLAVKNVRLVRGRWNQQYIDEHCEFPTGAHDDVVDAASGAFNKLAGKRKSQAS